MRAGLFRQAIPAREQSRTPSLNEIVLCSTDAGLPVRSYLTVGACFLEETLTLFLSCVF